MYKFDVGTAVRITEGKYERRLATVIEQYPFYEGAEEPHYEIKLGDGSFIVVNEKELTTSGIQYNDQLLFTGETPMYEMATVAGGFINIRLTVNGDEGNYPHFHFYHNTPANKGIKNKGHGGGCLMIREPLYFIHGSHTETLDNDEIQPLLTFLNSKHEDFNVTNWQYIVKTWNTNNLHAVVTGERCNTPPPYAKNMKSYREKRSN